MCWSTSPTLSRRGCRAAPGGWIFRSLHDGLMSPEAVLAEAEAGQWAETALGWGTEEDELLGLEQQGYEL